MRLRSACFIGIAAITATCGLGCGEPEIEATPLTDEAGFIEIAPVDYTLRGEGEALSLTSSRARLTETE